MNETYPGFPEIRKDLTYELITETQEMYEAWSKFYAGLPNVKVIYQPKGANK